MVIDRLVYWGDIVSPHLIPFFEALKRSSRWKEIVYVSESSTIGNDRITMGWKTPESEVLETILEPSSGKIREICSGKKERTLHLLPGIHGPKMAKAAVELLAKNKSFFSFVGEPRDSGGLIGKMRLLDSWAKERKYRSQVSFVLAIGMHGPAWYSRVGYSEKQIYPFGYFVDVPKINSLKFTEENTHHSRQKVRLLYVGGLIKSKGVYDLIRALAKTARMNWYLEFIGGGIEEQQLKNDILAMGLTDKVQFSGVKSGGEVLAVMQNSDWLILPSNKKDGWGVVVSEALLMGTRVIVSNYCGASILVAKENEYGIRFQGGDVGSLSNALVAAIQMGRTVTKERTKISASARKSISPESAAKYFNAIVDYQIHIIGEARPVAPWLM